MREGRDAHEVIIRGRKIKGNIFEEQVLMYPPAY